MIGSRFIVTFIGSGPVIYVYFIAARYLCLYPGGESTFRVFHGVFFFGWGENDPINVMRNVRSERDGWYKDTSSLVSINSAEPIRCKVAIYSPLC